MKIEQNKVLQEKIMQNTATKSKNEKGSSVFVNDTKSITMSQNSQLSKNSVAVTTILSAIVILGIVATILLRRKSKL